jgi:hypothetical protein
MMVIACSECFKSGMFDLNLKFTHRLRNCSKCHHVGDDAWTYWFCNTECMFKWLKENKVEEEGFPCQDCQLTGFAYGFKQNGTCQVCQGTKRIKTRINMDGYPKLQRP